MIVHGKIKGNMNHVGARKAFTCDEGLREITGQTHTVCQPTGEWDYSPVCTYIQGTYAFKAKGLFSSQHSPLRERLFKLLLLSGRTLKKP